MGIFFSRFVNLIRLLSTPRETRLLLLGLDGAGKTTIVYKMKLGETVMTIPTIGFNVETITYRNLNFSMWDVGGQHKIRPLWKHYFHGTEALVFVVDCNDTERIDEVKEELNFLLQADELRNAALLIYANKQDLPNSMSSSQVVEKLELHALRQRQWYVQPCCAVTGDGLCEGLDWAAGAVRKARQSSR